MIDHVTEQNIAIIWHACMVLALGTRLPGLGVKARVYADRSETQEARGTGQVIIVSFLGWSTFSLVPRLSNYCAVMRGAHT